MHTASVALSLESLVSQLNTVCVWLEWGVLRVARILL